jgi:capsule polysaccharide export protein KpsE/RkpR
MLRLEPSEFRHRGQFSERLGGWPSSIRVASCLESDNSDFFYLGRFSLKHSMGADSVQQFPEVEVSALDNDVGQTVSEVSQRAALDWAWLLWLNRRLLERWMTRGLVVSVLIAFLIPKEFESTTRLMPPEEHSGSGMGSGLAMMAALAGGGASSLAGSALGGIAGDLLGKHDAGAVFTDMLRSRTVEDRMVAHFDLRKVYRTRYWEDARKKLAERTSISADRKSGVITLTVTDRDPQRAAKLAQSYVEELDRIAAEVNTSAARRERIFIEQRLTAVKQDLAVAAQNFSEYSSKNGTIDIKEQGKATVEAAAVLQGHLIAAQSELEGLEQIYTSSNIRVRSLQARVDELQRQLKKVGSGTSTLTSNDSTSSQEFPSIRQLPLLGVRWAELYRETKLQETVYELLTQQYEQAKIEEAKETPVVKVLDVAVVPERKSGPARLPLVFLGTLLTFVAASGWVLGSAAWQRINPDEPRKRLAQEIGARFVVAWSQAKARWQSVLRRMGRTTSTDLDR